MVTSTTVPVPELVIIPTYVPTMGRLQVSQLVSPPLLCIIRDNRITHVVINIGVYEHLRATLFNAFLYGLAKLHSAPLRLSGLTPRGYPHQTHPLLSSRNTRPNGPTRFLSHLDQRY